ncbi:MAG: response regulator [Deltaproteobacteria bacterium]|nr:response regulator [Deltaproteobacteria bacterium]
MEDDADVAELLSMCVDTLLEGVVAEHAPSGVAALERLEAGARFDLILCDIMMPGMDGARLLRELSSRGLLQDQRVAVLSAVERERIVDTLAMPNVVGFIRKPVDPIRLAELIKGFLSAGSP